MTTAHITSSRELASVGAGSALLAVGHRLLVVGDDAWTCAWVDPATGAETPWVLAGTGERLVKPLKPDFEAAAMASDGAVWLFGSGSLSNRTSLVRLAGGHVTVVDGTSLYAALADVVGAAPNIEGALFDGSTLRLAHRATGRDPDLLLDVPAAALHGGRPTVSVATELAPVVLDGVPAHVTDLATAGPGRVALLAAAEDTLDPVLDGAVTGAAIGVWDGERVSWQQLFEADGAASVRKPEGLVLDPDGAGGWLVTDRDDPSLPAELCRFTL